MLKTRFVGIQFPLLYIGLEDFNLCNFRMSAIDCGKNKKTNYCVEILKNFFIIAV